MKASTAVQAAADLRMILSTGNPQTNVAIRRNMELLEKAYDPVIEEVKADADLQEWIKDKDDEKHPEAKARAIDYDNCEVEFEPYRVNPDNLPSAFRRPNRENVTDDNGKETMVVTGWVEDQHIAAIFDQTMAMIGAL